MQKKRNQFKKTEKRTLQLHSIDSVGRLIEINKKYYEYKSKTIYLIILNILNLCLKCLLFFSYTLKENYVYMICF